MEAEHTRQRGVPTLAILLVIIGVVLLLQTMDVLDWRLWVELLRYWPVLLIVAGISILLGGRAPLLSAGLVTLVLAGSVTAAAFTLDPRPAPIVADRDVNVVATLGSTERTVSSPEFRRGEATAVLGNVELDLRQAGLADQGARLTATAVFGNVDIRVPSNWNVRVEGTPVLGSVEDSRRAPSAPPAGPTLVLDATAVFGSVRLLD